MSKTKLLFILGIALLIVIALLPKLQNKRIFEKVDITALDPALHDTSWLLGDSCETGCWNGLTPGKTLREDAVSEISVLSFVNKNKIFEDETSFYFYCNPPMNETGCGRLIFENGLLEHIFLSLNYSISMDQAVRILGMPDGYSCFPTDPGATGYELSIFYTKKQLILAYMEYRNELLSWTNNVCNQITVDGRLPVGYPVQDVHFLYPYILDEMTDAQPWVGFIE
ncbi:MAG: hypothetical protein J0M11_02135 [Anaerolineae bacterium]|nr:hypothetical protein [Anaerolineae bacterium]